MQMLNVIQRNSAEGNREVSCHKGGLNTLILRDLGYLPFLWKQPLKIRFFFNSQNVYFIFNNSPCIVS